jgi:hypothetical protein
METGKNLLTDIVGSGRYIIDAVGFYNLGKTACRIYMFSDDIDIYDPYSIMSYFVSLQTTSLYNNSVRDWLTLYSLSYLDQYIDDDIVHDWPVKLPDPPPSINFYPVQIILNKADSKLNSNSKWSINDTVPNKSYNYKDIILFDFGTFGATNWQQVQDNYDEFEFGNGGSIRIWEDSDSVIDAKEFLNKSIGRNYIVKIININESGYTIFNNLEEKDYPWHDNYTGYHFRTQIVFYNDGVKLKMTVNYELYAIGGGHRVISETVEANFEINTIAGAYIRLKEK